MKRRRNFRAPDIDMGDRQRDLMRIKMLENRLAQQPIQRESPEFVGYEPEPDSTNYLVYVGRFVFLATFATFIVLLWMWMKKNPRKCAKKECIRTVSANDNALRVVAAQLTAGPVDKDGNSKGGCSLSSKSQAVQSALEKTVKELEY